MYRTMILLVCFLFNAAATLPQSVGGQLQSYQADLTAAKATPPGSPQRHEAVKHLVNPRFHPQRFVLFAMGYDEVLLQQMLCLWDQSRVDKQIGSTAGTPMESCVPLLVNHSVATAAPRPTA